MKFDAHIRGGHLHKAEPFLDTFHPFVLTQCRQPLRDGLEQCAGCDLRRVRRPIVSVRFQPSVQCVSSRVWVQLTVISYLAAPSRSIWSSKLLVCRSCSQSCT